MDSDDWSIILLLAVIVFVVGGGVGACSYSVATRSDECTEACSLFDVSGQLIDWHCYCKTSPPRALGSLLSDPPPATAEAP